MAFHQLLRRELGIGQKDRGGYETGGQLSLPLDATGYRAMLRDSRGKTTEWRLENVQELIGPAGGFHTARELLDHAALSTGRPNENAQERTPRVRLMTLHKAKGLEFDDTFLPAWEQDTFPPDYGDRNEKRRLVYVEITRGMRRVTISHCEFRRGYSQPSCFIGDLLAAHQVVGWLRIQHRPTPRQTLPQRLPQRSRGPSGQGIRQTVPQAPAARRRWDRLRGNQKEWDLEGKGWRTYAVDARVRRLCIRRGSRAALTRSRPRTDGMDGLRI